MNSTTTSIARTARAQLSKRLLQHLLELGVLCVFEELGHALNRHIEKSIA